MITIGVLHFTNPTPFVRIMPPWLPAPLWLVWLSGAAEIALGALCSCPTHAHAGSLAGVSSRSTSRSSRRTCTWR
jgi:uncharacterized membrane protein